MWWLRQLAFGVRILFLQMELTDRTVMYNITEGTTAAPGNELGIFETMNDIYSQTDLDLFFSHLARYTPHLAQSRMITLTSTATSPTARIQSTGSSTAPQPQHHQRIQAPNPPWTSKSHTQSSGRRTQSSSKPTTPSTRETTPSPAYSTTSSTQSTAPTATHPKSLSTLHTQTPPQAATRAQSNAASTTPQT